MLGSRIRQLRIEKGFSLTEFAEKAGISKSNLSNIERNLNQNPTFDYLVKIANAFGMNHEELLFEINRGTNRMDKTESISFVRKFISELSEKELEELKDYIEFTIRKKGQAK